MLICTKYRTIFDLVKRPELTAGAMDLCFFQSGFHRREDGVYCVIDRVILFVFPVEEIVFLSHYLRGWDRIRLSPRCWCSEGKEECFGACHETISLYFWAHRFVLKSSHSVELRKLLYINFEHDEVEMVLPQSSGIVFRKTVAEYASLTCTHTFLRWL